MNCIAVILARGGSKGIPRKNLIEFCGHPLAAWSIVQARECSLIDGVFVSTDSEEIANVSRAYGAEVIDRPAEISNDTASSELALLHAADYITKLQGKTPNTLVFLQPTSPLRESSELEEAIKKFESEKLDSLFSAAVPEDFLIWHKKDGKLCSLNYDFKSRKRRQDAGEESKLWIETGSFYIIRTESLMRTKNRLDGNIGVYELPIWKAFEVDSIEGLRFCETLMRHYKLDRNPAMREKLF